MGKKIFSALAAAALFVIVAGPTAAFAGDGDKGGEGRPKHRHKWAEARADIRAKFDQDHDGKLDHGEKKEGLSYIKEHYPELFKKIQERRKHCKEHHGKKGHENKKAE